MNKILVVLLIVGVMIINGCSSPLISDNNQSVN